MLLKIMEYDKRLVGDSEARQKIDCTFQAKTNTEMTLSVCQKYKIIKLKELEAIQVDDRHPKLWSITIKAFV